MEEEEVLEKGIETLNLDISVHHYIYLENTLPRSAYDLTLYENRILSVVASKMRPTDGPDQCYYFRIQDFAKLFGLSNVYDNLQENLLRLRSKSFLVKRKDETSSRITGWIREAEIIPASGIVQVTIDPRVRPYFLEIKKALGYFRYKLDNVRAFTNSSAFRLYVRMKAEFKGKRTASITMTIPEFRAWMNFKKEYTRYADLKRRIIIPAINDINGVVNGKRKEIENHSDISVSYVEIFESRKIAGIIFKAVLTDLGEAEEFERIKNDIPGEKITEPIKQTIDTYFTDGLHRIANEEEKKAIEYFLGLRIERKLIKDAVEMFGIENLKNISQYVIAKTPSITTSPAGYAVSALKGGFGIIKSKEVPEKKAPDTTGAKREFVDPEIKLINDQNDIYRSKYEQDEATVDEYLKTINEDKISQLIADCKITINENLAPLFRCEDALTVSPSKVFFYKYVAKNILGLE